MIDAFFVLSTIRDIAYPIENKGAGLATDALVVVHVTAISG